MTLRSALGPRSTPPLGSGSAVRPAVDRLRARFRDDRGDVPGWVLITLMTAGLVILIWGLAGDALGNVFETAIDRVIGM